MSWRTRFRGRFPDVPVEPWRPSAARAGGFLATVALGLFFQFNARLDERGVLIDGPLIILGVAGAVLVIASTARALWPMGLFKQQAIVSAPLFMVAVAALPLGGEPLRAVDVLAVPIAGVIWSLILGGVQILAWRPGSDRRIRAFHVYVNTLRASDAEAGGRDRLGERATGSTTGESRGCENGRT